MSFLSAGNYLHYYLNLLDTKVVSLLRSRYRGKGVVYGLRCRPTGQMYIGHTMSPSTRFYNHLITHDTSQSNTNLQLAIERHGLGKFIVYIYAALPYDTTNYATVKDQLRRIEQQHINRFPTAQLYNKINSKAVL
jgi:group I intron endonuclease